MSKNIDCGSFEIINTIIERDQGIWFGEKLTLVAEIEIWLLF